MKEERRSYSFSSFPSAYYPYDCTMYLSLIHHRGVSSWHQNDAIPSLTSLPSTWWLWLWENFATCVCIKSTWAFFLLEVYMGLLNKPIVHQPCFVFNQALTCFQFHLGCPFKFNGFLWLELQYFVLFLDAFYFFNLHYLNTLSRTSKNRLTG